MKLGVLGIVSVFLLSGCAGSSDSACKSLNAEWSRTVKQLNQLPSAFSEMTREQGIEWSALIDAKRSVSDQIMELENCTFEFN